MVPKLVTEEMNAMLTAPFTEGEVKRALFQMHPTKAPGLDGFPALFYQSNWNTLGHDIVKEVLKCLNSGILDAGLNETLVVLIPKVKKVERVEELRPISLCNVMMKIITKTLANRLKDILPTIISQNQSAFINGRLITDNILIAHEVSHSIKCKSGQKTGFVSLKLDMSKAYDRIEWEFLRRMMLMLGFAEEWVKKVMLCVETVSYKIRINDNISEPIMPSRGLRQGDIVEANSSYLGLPIIFSNKKVELFKAIEEKIQKRIGNWKHKLLSGAGREVLIKSVLQSIPLYAMSCFKIPLALCKKLTGDVLRFWWNHDKEKGIHWMKADDLCKGRWEGGLGFRKFALFNVALLAKQGWRLLNNPDLLVSRLFSARYYPESNILNAREGGRPSYAWRGIKEALNLLRYGIEWDSSEMRYFWKHDSSGTLTVKSAYHLAWKLKENENNVVGEPSDGKESLRFWKGFWRLKVPHRIKIFGWRLFHDSLPTMQNLSRRGCVVENKCWLCGKAGEYALHLFRDCWWIKWLLQDLHLPSVVWNNHCTSPGYWLWLSAKVCLEEEFKTFLCGLWLGWKHRNSIVHGKENGTSESLKVKLKWMINEFKNGGKDPCWSWDQCVKLNENHVIMCDGSYDMSTKEAGQVLF
ncbi:hypothetical protein QQ045_008160 [Rhodiola kirilowii]